MTNPAWPDCVTVTGHQSHWPASEKSPVTCNCVPVGKTTIAFPLVEGASRRLTSAVVVTSAPTSYTGRFAHGLSVSAAAGACVATGAWVGAGAGVTGAGVGAAGAPGVGARTTAVAVGGAGVASLIGVITTAISGVWGGCALPSPMSADAQYQSNPINRRRPTTGSAIRR